MTYDMSRGRPRIDPTMPRVLCRKHDEVLAQAYLGRERYGCFACALDEWEANEDALAILRAANLPRRAAGCTCVQYDEVTGDPIPCYC